jgi:DNA-binding SARP family transcriptional activator
MRSERKVIEHSQRTDDGLNHDVIVQTVAVSPPRYRPVAPATGTLSIQLLGGFSVTVGERRLVDADWYLREAMALVKLLALAPDGRLDRRQVIGYLWPNVSEAVASSLLDRAIQVARRVLDGTEFHRSESSYLSVSDDSIGLSCACTMTVDVDAFDRAARKAMGAHNPELYDEAVVAYPGDLLPDDLQHEWTAGPRRHLMSVYATLVEARSTAMRTVIPGSSGGWLRDQPQIA